MSEKKTTRRLAAYAGVREMIRDHGIDQAFNLTRSYSYDAIELLYISHECDGIINEANEYISAEEEYGIKIACISCYADVVSKTPPYTVDRRSVEAIKRCIDLASEVGCPLVHHTLVTRLFGTREDYHSVLPSVVSAAEEIAEYAEGLGIDILYEPQGFLFNGLDGYSEFFDIMRSGHRNVGVCLDVGNTLWVDEDCYPLAEKYKEYVKHVHIKDYKIDCADESYKTLGGRTITEVALGEGIVDLEKILNILESVDYSGFISVEDNSTADQRKTAQRARRVVLGE